MTRPLRINNTTGCERPSNCRGNPPALCGRCYLRKADPTREPVSINKGGAIIRIEITTSRRRRLTEMAREAGIPVDELASRLLSELINDDAAAHGEKVTE